MSFIRLKTYTDDIFKRYLRLQDEPTEDEKSTALGRKVRLQFNMCCKTVLFFSQPNPEMTLAEWCEVVPTSVLFQIHHFTSLLEDSARWSISAVGMPLEIKPDAMVQRLLSDIDNFRIILQPEYEDDAVTTQFEKICNLIHDEIPNNLRKRKALIRLIWSYLAAKELIIMSREYTSCDRVDYLRRLTKY